MRILLIAALALAGTSAQAADRSEWPEEFKYAALLKAQPGCPEAPIMTYHACGLYRLRSAGPAIAQKLKAKDPSYLPPYVRAELRRTTEETIAKMLGAPVTVTWAKSYQEQDGTHLTCGAYLRSGQLHPFFFDSYALNLKATDNWMGAAGCKRGGATWYTLEP